MTATGLSPCPERGPVHSIRCSLLSGNRPNEHGKFKVSVSRHSEARSTGVRSTDQHGDIKFERQCLDPPYHVHHVLVSALLARTDKRAEYTSKAIDDEEMRRGLAGGQTVTKLLQRIQNSVTGERADDRDVAQRLPVVAGLRRLRK
jgi:hypothetical protein